MANLVSTLWAPSPSLAHNSPGPQRRATAGRHIGALACYLLLALLMTWPLARNLSTRLPGNNFDAWQNYWNFWWLREALAAGRNPYYTPLLYAPYGAPLYLHTLNPFNGLVTLPVQWLFGLAAAYNTAVLLSFTLNGYFASLLVTHVSGSRLAGFVAGALYAFSGYHLGHFFYGQTNLLASEWLPAFVLALLVATSSTGRRRALYTGGGAGALLLATLVDWQYALFGVLFATLFACWRAIGRRALAPLAVAAAIGVLWLVAVAPLLAATIGEVRTLGAPLATEGFLARYSADLVSLIIPSPRQRWWGAVTNGQGPLWAASLAYDRAAAPGVVMVALAAIGVWRAGRRAFFWLAAAALFALLALGPFLQIGGQGRFGAARVTIRLPYSLLALVPGVNIARVPSRFLLVTLLCLVVLAGLAIAAMLAAQRRTLVRVGLAVLIMSAGLAEQFAAPFPSTTVAASPFYARLGASNEAGAVLDLPLYYQNPRGLFYQTIHGRPLVAGYLSRELPYPLASLPPFAALLGQPAGPDIVPPDPAGLPARALAFANVRWIVIRRDLAHLDQPPLADFLARWVEPAPLYSDDQIIVYRPRAVGDPASTALVARPGAGWAAPEPLGATGAWMRWIGRAAMLNVWVFGPQPAPRTLRFDVWSFNRPRRLQVSLDGAVVGEWRVNERQTLELPLVLAPGEHHLELRALDSPDRPVDVGQGNDTRELSFGVTGIDFR